ncbi:25 kDa outer-membrane immunogenic protein precursor [Liberibacter crescens BT-1]|uniref:25 kDa outer-membrane immunogenic protein n=1 Tax=Liberibacter crescens (strain BT-1) TaxID=1215343 RepID=L0EWW5_LIBCB|nr:outer membrane protein [Liberibacter crescens]AGA65143.1 25 kDa outer-membrane immunogenic protein precursor [Liberibacter crescens BT-1]AMC13111.1 hypothetical protein RL73_05830 [Liberibacter crescens]
MRNVFLTLGASTIVLASFFSANAADAVHDIQSAPSAPSIPSTPSSSGLDWSGAYIGGQGFFTNGRLTNPRTRSKNAFGGGVYGGYNLQYDHIVYGVEGDLGYSRIRINDTNVVAKTGFQSSLRGRVGYAFDPVLLYATGGLALGRNKFSAIDNSVSVNKVGIGYTVGAGVETFLTDNVTARLEYRYTRLGKKDFTLRDAAFSRGYSANNISVGIGVKF